MFAALLIFLFGTVSVLEPVESLPGPSHPNNAFLSSEEIAWLPPDESSVYSSLPAFFRIQVRKANPHIPSFGRVRYPRVSGNVFERLYPTGRNAAAGGDGLGTGEANISGPDEAREVSLAINPVDPEMVVAGANGPLGQIMFASFDGAQTWRRSEDLPQGGTCCDPSVAWSSDGLVAYASTMGGCTAGGCNVWVYRSDTSGLSWDGLSSETPGDPRRELSEDHVSDKPFLHVDHGAQSPFKDNIYVAWHEGFSLRVAVSQDRAQSFSAPRNFPGEPAGLGADIATGPDGTVYVVWPTLNREIRVVRSTDGGQTFLPSDRVAQTQAQIAFPIPAAEGRGAFIYASVDVDLSVGPHRGRVHVAWTDSLDQVRSQPAANHARIGYAHSDDALSWQVATPHSTDDGLRVDRWHPWLRTDDRGNLHLVYYDSRHSENRGGLDLYYQLSDDGGATFSPARRLSATTSSRLPAAAEYGDYNALDVQRSFVVAGYTDGRSETPTQGSEADVYSVRGYRALGDRLFVSGFEAVP